jgi:hypothetical protein
MRKESGRQTAYDPTELADPLELGKRCKRLGAAGASSLGRHLSMFGWFVTVILCSCFVAEFLKVRQ